MKERNILRGRKLLRKVFKELLSQIPTGEASESQLLEASWRLIELSKNEFLPKAHSDAPANAGYYSYDLCTAFEKFQGRIFMNEVTPSDDLGMSEAHHHELNSLICGTREDMIMEDIYG